VGRQWSMRRICMPGTEALLKRVVAGEKKNVVEEKRAEELSEERKKLLGVMMRKKAPAASWFPGIEKDEERLFWFPHAGGGAGQIGELRSPWQARRPTPLMIGVRLPGREARIGEAPFERMRPL